MLKIYFFLRHLHFGLSQKRRVYTLQQGNRLDSGTRGGNCAKSLAWPLAFLGFLCAYRQLYQNTLKLSSTHSCPCWSSHWQTAAAAGDSSCSGTAVSTGALQCWLSPFCLTSQHNGWNLARPSAKAPNFMDAKQWSSRR